MYVLLSAIKEDISSMKKEMNTINERITKLEKNNKQNQEPNKEHETTNNKGKGIQKYSNPVNDKGFISTYERNRRSIPRNFEQQPNSAGKRQPLNSETYASTSDNNNPVKARKISFTANKGYNQSSNKNNEVEEIRQALNDKTSKLDELNEKIEKLTVLLWNQDKNNKKESSSNTNNEA